MMAAAVLAVWVLLGPPPPRTYYWKDAAGQTHVTNTPPPADAEMLAAPPPPAVEPPRPPRPVPTSFLASRQDASQTQLTPEQRHNWEALEQHLAKARAAGDRQAMEAVADSLIHDCLWGHGLWIMPLAPLLAMLLMGLMGWWLALGLRMSSHLPLVGAFLGLGVVFGHLLLTTFLYHPQAMRLQQTLHRLESHLGSGHALRPESQLRLQQRYQALERSASPFQAPWRFPSEVEALRETLKQVMVEP
jgi:hypothetical protein